MKTIWPIHSDDEINAVVSVLRSGKTNMWTGHHTQAFEAEFAAYTGAKHALAVSNGTTALEVALHAIRPDRWGGDVIVPARTFIATASAVATMGMVPVIADIDESTLNVTVETLEARRNYRTKAVIVVHFGGLPCDMPAIMEWANKHDIAVIEDCAHAHGARINGRHVGTFGAVGCFSFCVGKNISTGGEGGMVISNDDRLFAKMGARRDHGRYQMTGARAPGDTVQKDMTQFQWTVTEFGTNLRMTEMQSAIGRVQLSKLNEWLDRRYQIASQYDAAFRGLAITPPVPRTYEHAWYLYVMRVANRDAVMRRLNELMIPARLGGCPNISREAVFDGFESAKCPVADSVGLETMSLPIYPTMTGHDIDEVISKTAATIKQVNGG